MAQGDIAAKLDKMLKELDSLNNGNTVSQKLRENAIQQIIESHAKSIDAKKEAYKYDLRQDTISSYIKKVYKRNKDVINERIKLEKEQERITELIEKYKEEEIEAAQNGKTELSKYILKRRTQLETEKIINEAMEGASDTAEAAAKTGNPYLAAIIVVGGAVFTAVKTLATAAFSLFKIVGGFVTDMFGSDLGIGAVYETFLRMQKITGDFSADAGLIASESENFLGNMPRIMNEVLDVGGTIEQIGEVMDKLTNVTGKNRMFTGKQFKNIIELGLGTGLGVEEGSELIGNFDNLGYSLDQTLELTDYARNKAMRVSQNQTGVLKKVNELVISLTGFGISRGLKGLTDLVVKTQKLRIDVVKSVDSFKDAFTDPETAVEVAATAKLLGGKFASYFGDPFTLMGKSVLEPEELTADLIEALKGKAFKGRNGFQMSPADRQIIKEFAESINQDADELMNGAIEQAKFTDKIDALDKKGFSATMNSEQKDLITNLMTLNEDGSYSVRLSNGVIKRLEEIPSINVINQTLLQNRRNDESALLRKTLAERIGIAIDRFNIGFSQVFVVLNRYFTQNDTMNNLDSTVASVSNGMINWLNQNMSNTGLWGVFIRKGLKAANEMIDKVLGIWLNPDTIFTQKFGETLNFIFKGLNDILVPYIQYYGGRIVELLGNVLPGIGEKFQKIGLEVQKNALNNAGENSILSKNKKNSLTQRINTWNENNGGVDLSSPAIKTGAYLTSKSAAKILGKSIVKKIPGIGLVLGVFDAIGQVVEGDWDQAGIALASGALTTIPGVGTAASVALDLGNAYIDNQRGDNHISVQDAVIRPDGSYYDGNKGDTISYLKSLIEGNMSTNASKKTSVNLVLKGKITNISRNTRLTDKELDASISESSKMILKQVITNLQTSAV
jgi:hypothetical protein